MRARRFPPPWIVEEHSESFIVKDAAGTSPGSFAKLTAIRRASSLVSSLAADRRPGSSSK
jgi:hypothetical protein